MTSQLHQQPIVLFDGLCNLCNSSVQFIIRHDKHHQFSFASLQSDFAQALLQTHPLARKVDSVILCMDNQVFIESAAALRIARMLSGAWSLLYVLILIPRPLRDAAYRVIARNRIRWFGKRESCMIPTLELRSRFLDTPKV